MMVIHHGALPFLFCLRLRSKGLPRRGGQLCGFRYEPLEVFCLLGASSSAVLLSPLCLKTGDTFPHELPAHP